MNPGVAEGGTAPDILVVGLGLAGATVARELADRGWRVHAIDRRRHIAGNAFDEHDEAGVLVHRYGPHIFHTNAERVVAHLSRFTGWRPYEHRVQAFVRGRHVPFPINRTTLELLFGGPLDNAGAAALLERLREPRFPRRTSEDVVVDAVGQELCDLFYRGYTRKQWGLDLSQLAASVAARIAVRSDDDDRYFNDTFQAMPADGYAAMVQRMLDHPRVSHALDCDFGAVRGHLDARHLVYTGPIDAFFEHRFGALPYRSLRFEHVHLPGTERLLPATSVNFPNDFEYTRITEFKWMTGQAHPGTSVVYEYPAATGEPLYPIPRPETEALLRRYRELAEALPDVTFVGRLAQYRYYNMDQVVAAALTAAERIDASLRAVSDPRPTAGGAASTSTRRGW